MPPPLASVQIVQIVQIVQVLDILQYFAEGVPVQALGNKQQRPQDAPTRFMRIHVSHAAWQKNRDSPGPSQVELLDEAETLHLKTDAARSVQGLIEVYSLTRMAMEREKEREREREPASQGSKPRLASLIIYSGVDWLWRIFMDFCFEVRAVQSIHWQLTAGHGRVSVEVGPLQGTQDFPQHVAYQNFTRLSLLLHCSVAGVKAPICVCPTSRLHLSLSDGPGLLCAQCAQVT